MAEVKQGQQYGAFFPLMLCEYDLCRFGNTTCGDFDPDSTPGDRDCTQGTAFFLDLATANIEEMFIQTIVKGLGYDVIQTCDFVGNGPDSIMVRTTYPWERYMKMSQERRKLQK